MQSVCSSDTLLSSYENIARCKNVEEHIMNRKASLTSKHFETYVKEEEEQVFRFMKTATSWTDIGNIMYKHSSFFIAHKCNNVKVRLRRSGDVDL
jgi:prenyltransferase beta subunit